MQTTYDGTCPHCGKFLRDIIEYATDSLECPYCTKLIFVERVVSYHLHSTQPASFTDPVTTVNNIGASNIQNRKYKAQENYRARLKMEVIEHYGGSCKQCGMTDIRYLTVDHVDGLTINEPKNERSGYRFYLRLRREGFPEGYQVLCFHCNVKKQ